MELWNIQALKSAGCARKGAEDGDGVIKDDAWVCSLGKKLFAQCLSHNGCLINMYINKVHCHDDCFFYH